MPMKKSIDNINQARLLEELRIKSAAIDSAVNGIAFGDLEGRVTYANTAAIKLTGYTLDEVLGWSILTFADNQEEAALIFAQVLEKGSWIGEVAGRKKDGSLLVVHLSASLVRDDLWQSYRYFVFLRGHHPFQAGVRGIAHQEFGY